MRWEEFIKIILVGSKNLPECWEHDVREQQDRATFYNVKPSSRGLKSLCGGKPCVWDESVVGILPRSIIKANGYCANIGASACRTCDREVRNCCDATAKVRMWTFSRTGDQERRRGGRMLQAKRKNRKRKCKYHSLWLNSFKNPRERRKMCSGGTKKKKRNNTTFSRRQSATNFGLIFQGPFCWARKGCWKLWNGIWWCERGETLAFDSGRQRPTLRKDFEDQIFTQKRQSFHCSGTKLSVR